MGKPKVFVFEPPSIPPTSETVEALKQERKDKPYLVCKYMNGSFTSVWERDPKGHRVTCVHHNTWKKAIGRENDENAVVSSALRANGEVFYCTKKEVFMICL